MIIKIDAGRYINTDQIQVIEPHKTEPDKSQLHFSRATVIVPNIIVEYIADVIEANTGLVDPGETEGTAINTRPLASRISSLLRDHLNGLTFSELMDLLSLKAEDETELELALKRLVEDNTVTTEQEYGRGAWRWYHRSTPGATNQW